MKTTSDRLIMAITGASGALLGIRLLELLNKLNIETHLILSNAARKTISIESHWQVPDVEALATRNYDIHNIGACLASGSFVTCGMLVVPCSIKTLSAIANSYSNNLITRAADVCLKEGRPLLLAVRETPLHPGHLRIMKQAAQAGAIIFPPIPAFYAPSQSLDDILTNIAGRMLQRIGFENDYYHHWNG